MFLMARNRAAALCLSVFIAALATPLLCEWRCGGSAYNPLAAVDSGHHSHVTHELAPEVLTYQIEPAVTSGCAHDDATVSATARGTSGSAPLSHWGHPHLLASTKLSGPIENQPVHLETAGAPRGLPPPLARVLRL